MEILYRVVGALAPVNQRLSRHRVNFIPANMLLMIGLGALVAVNWVNMGRVLAARRTPDAQPVRDILFRPHPARSYVALQGRLLSQSRLDFAGAEKAGNLILADSIWIPLVDRSTQHALLVQFDAKRAFEGGSQDVTIQGMIRPILPAVLRRLSQSDYRLAGVTIDRRYQLIEGTQPGSLVSPVANMIIFTMLLLSLLWLTLSRNVVFMRVEMPQMPAGAVGTNPAEPMLLSAMLTRDSKTHRFFTNMPAILTRVDSGDVALLSHIETSARVMGVKTKPRVDTWILAIRGGSISDVHPGYVFWGRQKLRAVRFSYVNRITNKPDHAVLASSVIDPLSILRT